MADLTTTQKKLIFIVIFTLLTISTEFFYRNSLYEASIDAELSMKKCITCMNLELYFTLIGSEYSLIFLEIIIFLLFPLSKTFSMAITMLTSNYINSILKLIFQNPRPFFGNENLFEVCEGGYGNPSGHTMSSMATFFAFSELLIDKFKPEKTKKILIYILTGIFVANIGISRLFLGLHSINQIIYGLLLGFIVYFIYFHYLQMHKIESKKFFIKIMNKTNAIKYAILFFLLFALIPFINLIFINEESEEYKKYYDQLFQICIEPEKVFGYRVLNKEGIYSGMSIVSLPGMFFGLFYLGYKNIDQYPGKEKYIDDVFSESNQGKIGKFKMIGICLCCLCGMILHIIIPNRAPDYVIYIFKVAIPLLISTFCLFGVAPSLSIKFQIANRNIYSETNENNEINRNTADSDTNNLKDEKEDITTNIIENKESEQV